MEYRKMDFKRFLPTLKTSSSQASAEVKRCWGSTLDSWSRGEIGFFLLEEKHVFVKNVSMETLFVRQ